MSIGERIRSRRLELRMTQDELAKKAGYKNRSSINKIENDGRNLSQGKIKAIADALDTTPSYIMGWKEKVKQLEPPISNKIETQCIARILEAMHDMEESDLDKIEDFVMYLKNKPQNPPRS